MKNQFLLFILLGNNSSSVERSGSAFPKTAGRILILWTLRSSGCSHWASSRYQLRQNRAAGQRTASAGPAQSEGRAELWTSSLETVRTADDALILQVPQQKAVPSSRKRCIFACPKFAFFMGLCIILPPHKSIEVYILGDLRHLGN